MSINERIKHLRNTLQMSQSDFAKAIFISNGYIADFENSKKKPNDRIIRLISLSFGVNESWLKHGTGGMFYTTPSDKLQRLTAIFNELPPIYQDYVMAQIEHLLAIVEKQLL